MNTINTVEFPDLGLKFRLNPQAFEIFGLSIYWYGIIIATAFLVTVLLGLRACRKFGFETDDIIDLVLFAAPVAIIGARLYYVIFEWSYFSKYPLEILDFRSGGLGLYGGIIGGIVTALIFAKVKKISIKKLFDFGAPYLLLGQGIGRWGNFINAEAYGRETSLPWGMMINGEGPYHPTFLYEFLWDIVVFAFLLWYRKRKKADGEVFYLYMILYGLGRSYIEGLRIDSLYIGQFRASQVLAIMFVVVFSIVFVVNRRKALAIPDEPQIGSSEYGAILRKLAQEEMNDQNREPVEKKEESAGNAVNPGETGGQQQEAGAREAETGGQDEVTDKQKKAIGEVMDKKEDAVQKADGFGQEESPGPQDAAKNGTSDSSGEL